MIVKAQTVCVNGVGFISEDCKDAVHCVLFTDEQNSCPSSSVNVSQRVDVLACCTCRFTFAEADQSPNVRRPES